MRLFFLNSCTTRAQSTRDNRIRRLPGRRCNLSFNFTAINIRLFLDQLSVVLNLDAKFICTIEVRLISLDTIKISIRLAHGLPVVTGQIFERGLQSQLFPLSFTLALQNLFISFNWNGVYGQVNMSFAQELNLQHFQSFCKSSRLVLLYWGDVGEPECGSTQTHLSSRHRTDAYDPISSHRIKLLELRSPRICLEFISCLAHWHLIKMSIAGTLRASPKILSPFLSTQ